MNKYLKFTFILVLADLITKLTANLLLPYGVAIKRISAVIFFHLSYNLTGKGSLATKYYNNNSELFFIACSVLIVSLFIFFIKNRNIQNWLKILLTIIVYIFTIICVKIFFKDSQLNFSDYFVTAFDRFVSIILLLAYFYITKNEVIRYIWLMMIAGSLGNLLSYIYPPYKVIDFIRVDMLTDYFNIGIFNLADAYIYFSYPALIILFLYNFISKFYLAKHNQRLNADRHFSSAD